ncbi:hypothetical protein NP493_742g01062 [Ridgeia piscesae]|uniref:LRRCT domain-containing protein n=1 Tax=Ridgeia piscesae TaxID=27915 RepID=A0AAD9NNT6_RIDPI|nr:hypothetical protein NP493_742g01062 [Ridgeia piscesae]
MAPRPSTRPPLLRRLLLLVATLQIGTGTAATVPTCVQSHGCEGQLVTCDGAGDVPTTLPVGLRMLKLTNTTMTVLQNGTFSHLQKLVSLDLSGNGLVSVTPDALAGLPHLKHLDLSHNELCFGDEAFPPNAFRSATALRSLVMHSNMCPSGHVGYPDKALGQLSALETLVMNGLPNVTLGPGFAKMTSLKSLELSGKHCNMGRVSGNTFASLAQTHVSQLSMRACNISSLDESAFFPLSRLKSLNLACNKRIGLDDATEAIRKATNISLETVILDDVSNVTVILNKRVFGDHLRALRRLSLRANDMIAVDVRMMHLLPELRTVSAGYNPMSADSFYPDKNYLEIMHKASAFIHLEVVDASHLKATRASYRLRFCAPDHVDFDEYFREKPLIDDVTYTRLIGPDSHNRRRPSVIPLSLQVAFLDHSRYHSNVNVSVHNDMIVLNMSYTDADVLKGPMSGFDNLQVFDASHCHIYRIYSDALRGLGRLKYLNLQHNVIGERGDDIVDQFHGLRSLLELDLSYNKIASIGRDAFRDLASVRKLNLRGNKLTVLGFDVGHMASVVSVDVSDNVLVYGDPAFVKGAAGLESTTDVDLRGNPFVCNCSGAAFARWVLATPTTIPDKNNLTCVNGTGHTARIVAVGALVDFCPAPVIHDAGTRSRGHYIGIILGCFLVAVVLVFIVIAVVWHYGKRISGNSKVAYRLFDVKLSM